MANLDDVTSLFQILEAGEESARLQLGQVLLEDELDLASPPSREQKLERAKKWLEKYGDQVRQKICRNTEILKHHDSNTIRSEIIVAAAVIDIVAAFASGPTVCAAGATILAIGLPKWCADIWNGPGSGDA